MSNINSQVILRGVEFKKGDPQSRTPSLVDLQTVDLN